MVVMWKSLSRMQAGPQVWIFGKRKRNSDSICTFKLHLAEQWFFFSLSDLKYNEADGRIYYLSEGNNSIIACHLSPKKCDKIYNTNGNNSQIQYPMAFAVNGAKEVFVAHDQKIAKLSYQESSKSYSYSVLRDKTVDVIAMSVYDKSQRKDCKLRPVIDFFFRNYV